MAIASRPKPKAHHRKRQAQHHKHNKNYAKTYWPYLPMMMLVAVGIAVNSIWSNNQVLGVHTDLSTTRLLQETNQERESEGQPPLSLSPQLNQAAQTKAEDMAKRNYWSHTGPKGESPWSFLAASGYQYQTAGENLAYGFADSNEIINGWMRSASHRANILSSDHEQVGFGVANSPNFRGDGPQVIVVAEYAQPAAPGSASTIDPASQTQSEAATTQPDTTRHIARLETFDSSQASLLLTVVVLLTAAASALFVFRHQKRVRAVVSKGESFVIKHPLLDIAAIAVIVIGVLLTRTSGVIQ